MDINKAIRERRSIRQYQVMVPGDEDIKKIIEAGLWAPSGLNNQPWKFKVVKEKAQKDSLARFTKYSAIIRDAPVVICVFLDNSSTYNREKDILAIGACIQNMLLSAWELGLGTCWLGEILNKKEDVRKYLKIDSDCELMAVVTLGYSDEEVSRGCRKNLKSFIIK
ncbi:MAG: nitroreductase [Candidatus Omnitrophica bacterium]|nr:nitroreductase [Candidatus Omnitrophota bacterium]